MNKIKKYHKAILIGVVAVVVIFSVVLITIQHRINRMNAEIDATNGTTSSSTTSNGSTADQPTALTYTQAVNTYKDRRVQFDAACVPVPAQLLVKNNTSIMLDNRSSGARSVFLDRVEYRLAGYGFKIVKVSYAKIPHTIVVDCGTGRNNGKVLVQ